MNQNWKNWKIEKIKKRTIKSNKIYIPIIFFFILIIILCNLKIIETLSVAEGEVKPQGRIKFIQHLEGGIVDEILVKEGEKVKYNQPLVILSREKASSEYEEINSRINAISLSILRVNAEKKMQDKIPNELTSSKFTDEQIRTENNLLKTSVKSYKLELKSKQSEIKQVNQNLQKIEKNVKNLKKKLNLVKEQIEISEKLLKAEATNRFKHLELLRELASTEGKYDEELSNKKMIVEKFKNSKLELEKLSINHFDNINNKISLLKKEKLELFNKIKKFSDNLNRTVLKSPEAGIIKVISVNSKGAIVAPGVTVLELVPEKDELIIEGKLPLTEIGYINIGMSAKIRLNSPDSSRYQPINGKVIFVGADRIRSENVQNYYIIRVRTSEKAFFRGEQKYNLYSGVPVTIGVIIEKRSIYDYLISPLKNKFELGLSERS